MIELKIKMFPQRNSPVSNIFQVNSIFKEEITLLFHTIFQSIKKEGILPNLYYEGNITCYNIWQEFFEKGKYRPIPQVNIDAKILNKIIANQIKANCRKENIAYLTAISLERPAHEVFY